MRLRQQPLADGVVDLVGAGVGQVLALEVDLGAAELAREVLGEVERRRPAGEVAQHAVQLAWNAGSALRGVIGALQLLDGGHQRLGRRSARRIRRSARVRPVAQSQS